MEYQELEVGTAGSELVVWKYRRDTVRMKQNHCESLLLFDGETSGNCYSQSRSDGHEWAEDMKGEVVVVSGGVVVVALHRIQEPQS